MRITRPLAKVAVAALVATSGQGVNLEWDSTGSGYLDSYTANTGTGAYSADGTTWTTVGTATPSGAAPVQDAGVTFCGHGETGTATFSQFSITL